MDPSGCAWYHWVIGGLLAVGIVALSVVTAGAIIAAAPAIAAFASSYAVALTGSVAFASFCATAISIGAVGALGALYMFAKASKLSGKEGATDKPSFVNSSMVDPNISAQENARRIMDMVFGPGNWNKATANNAFSKIVKWIIRHLWR